MRRAAGLLFVLVALPYSFADGPKDNVPDNVRPIPPKGVAVPDADLKELRASLDELRKELDALPGALKGKPALLELVPDVEVYHKAVRYAVEYGEFFNLKEVPVAKKLLAQGLQRAKELRDGKPSWTTATGLVVRGYRSKIDGSVQPYGLVVPASYSPTAPHKFRLDFWWHGRGETLSEVNFIQQRQTNPGEFAPANAFVLHPYGRYCNANKFAGEIDTLECLEHVKKHYPIDENRVVARGFSMGGAACWQFAVHYPTLWVAAAPGAGFAETREFLNDFQNEKVKPEWWEKKLWRMYDATEYAPNLLNIPTVAYSGENDRQKQAADVMARELKKIDIELTHIIGPKTAHAYEKGAKAEVNRRIDYIVGAGRKTAPDAVSFATYTLRYNRCAWVTIERMEKHWSLARVAGTSRKLVPNEHGMMLPALAVNTEGVTEFRISFGPGEWPDVLVVGIDGKQVRHPLLKSDRSWEGRYRKVDGQWKLVGTDDKPEGLAKTHGLQGPIDDAFMDRFLMVKPTGKLLNDRVGAWATEEMKHAVTHWRSQFRGDAPVKDDSAVTDEDIASSNLILWGDPSSNAILAKIADKLPVKWTKDGVQLGDKTYGAGTHVPVLIYPNPLNPRKYVVLNSGFTFREYDYLNNARQLPKLPDYAVLDVTTPPNSRWPGKVVRAGFFGEKWELLPEDGK
ncbi:MAG TPA: prolyl oligopeptidase family serine peptidase [Fimbriiglobus sp.]|nr:prolyl oligopeptidase family serine peptidase [Fimbriiglobus sp.]